MEALIISVIVIGLIGLITGGFLAYAAQRFNVEKDPKVQKVLDALPGANCGMCGFPGCSGYADAVVFDNAASTLCTPGGQDTAENIMKALGKNADGISVAKNIAKICCQGTLINTNKKYELDTQLQTCVQASLLFLGDKVCNYACLGYGDCVKGCPFEAMSINEQGIIEIDEDKCTGCGACVIRCPKNVIEIIPHNKNVAILCKSKDKAMDARKKCKVACIGCGLCVKSCPQNAIEIKDNLAVIDYEKCVNCGICALKCPTNAIKSEIKDAKKAKIDEDKCIGCTICKKSCPVDAILGNVKEKHKIIEEKCIGCGECIEKCPKKCIELQKV